MAERAGYPAWLAGVRSFAVLVCLLLVYYGLPLEAVEVRRDGVSLVAFAVGLVGLIWLVVLQIRRVVTDAKGRFVGVLSAVYLVVTFFALAYFIIERNSPGEFSGLSTRTDALYYAVVTLGTVGYGDVHAVGQVARVATIVQISIDLVLIGTLLAVTFTQLAQRLTRKG